jgi:short-subunit dehydrogenase
MKRNILITGGTSGIGAALARLLELDHMVFITGSKPEAAINDQSVVAHYIAADQSAPIEAANAIEAALQASGIHHLDLVFLNAGIGFWREPAKETAGEIRATLDVNFAATIAIAHRLFPLLERAKGKLVLIGSTSFKGQANLATYAASKAAMDGFARALRSEWQGRVIVQMIHPGPTATPMHRKAGLDAGNMVALFASAKTSAKMILLASKAKRLRTNLTFPRRMFFAATGWMRR